MVKITTAQSTQARLNGMTNARDVTTSSAASAARCARATDAAERRRGFQRELQLVEPDGACRTISWIFAPCAASRSSTMASTCLARSAGSSTPASSRTCRTASSPTPSRPGTTASASVNSPQFGQGQGYSPFTEAQKVAARVAVSTWDDLISAKFVEVAAGPGASVYGKNSADIVLANTTTGPAQAGPIIPA